MTHETQDYADRLTTSTDSYRWKWCFANTDKVVIKLDNDATYIAFTDGGDHPWIQFDEYIGWSDGVQELLSTMGLTAESV